MHKYLLKFQQYLEGKEAKDESDDSPDNAGKLSDHSIKGVTRINENTIQIEISQPPKRSHGGAKPHKKSTGGKASHAVREASG